MVRITRRLRDLGRLAILLSLGSIGMACVSGGYGASRVDQDVLTRSEIQQAEASTLYDVVQRLRPRWLREVRNRQDLSSVEGGVVVYEGQSFLGGPEVLREWGRDFVVRIVYLDGISASNQLPGPASNQHVEGAIVIHTR